MKILKHIILGLVILLTYTATAQQGISYKALIKDNNGNVLTNQEVGIRFIIKKPDSSSEYIETHTTTSDLNGIVVLNIGEGNPGQFNDFAAIDWGKEVYNLQVAIRLAPDEKYIVLDEVPFKTVPYALLAENVKNQTFKSEGGLTSAENITDDFVFGSTQLDDTGSSLGSSRMFFNTGKAAFRAGRALDNEWDDANIGNRSVAFGLNTIATGSYSTALGNRTRAESQSSTAIGTFNVGGGNPRAWVLTDPLFEVGNGTATINSVNRNNALTILKNGKVGIGFNSETPTQFLDVSGKIKVSNDFTTPTPGTIRFNETTNSFEGFIADTGWVTLGAKNKEKTIVIPALSFKTEYRGTSFSISSGSAIAFNTDKLYAPLVLPINSKIINITCIYTDSSSEIDLYFNLSKYCGESGTNQTFTTVDGFVQLNVNNDIAKATLNIFIVFIFLNFINGYVLFSF